MWEKEKLLEIAAELEEPRIGISGNGFTDWHDLNSDAFNPFRNTSF